MKLAIIKYNAGNTRSVINALNRLGIDPLITDVAEELASADKVIFPGVGEASSTMRHLISTGLDLIIPTLKQPVLGICLGMQLMCRHSEENDTSCMGIFDSEVKLFKPLNNEDVPHMGWNNLRDVMPPLFNSNLEGEHAYFVHSYYVPVSINTIATTDYIHPFSAALSNRNFFAVQFHPEKSSKAGQEIIKNFLEL